MKETHLRLGLEQVDLKLWKKKWLDPNLINCVVLKMRRIGVSRNPIWNLQMKREKRLRRARILEVMKQTEVSGVFGLKMAKNGVLGSVWIRLILLKLKIYYWNHWSKIIFKYVNSTVGPIFNEKVAKKWNLWVHKQYIMYCLLQKSQHLRLLFIEQYINSNRVVPKHVEKKKEQKRKTQNADGFKTQTCI